MSKNKKLAGEFRQFIAKGNVVDLAVAVVIGAAFNRIVSQIVDSFITPLLGLVLRGLSLAEWKWVVKEEVLDGAGEVLENEIAITYGLILQAIIDFSAEGRLESGKIVKEIGKRNDLRRSTFSFTGGQDNEELGLCTLLNK